MLIATAEEMRGLDAGAIQGRNIPSTLLMERAAEGILCACLSLLGTPEGKQAVVLSGPGNNGGDGVAVARLLREKGVQVRAFLVGKREKMTEDCREMERRLEGCGGRLEQFDPASEQQRQLILDADLLVDAIFGIGLHSDVRGVAADAIHYINMSTAKVVAADIASGVEADTGRILGCAASADRTVTFTLPKVGHYVGDGGLATGTLTVHSIGIPEDLVEALPERITAVDADWVKAHLPTRPEDGHKGTFGKCYLLSGSTGYTGAPVLASHGAVRSGTGLVFLGVPEPIYPIAAMKTLEAMPHPLPSDGEGRVTTAALETICTKAAPCDAMLIGPGLGRSEETERLTAELLKRISLPVVLDADGINALSGHMDVLEERTAPLVLTPHDGEFARLGGDLSEKDRVGTASAFARKYGCVLVLKGHRTVTACPDGRVFVNTTGNSGMAKGGSGDTLAGLLTGLVAQGMEIGEAAAAAVWIHGRAGDLCAEELGQRAMTPSDLITKFSQVFLELE